MVSRRPARDLALALLAGALLVAGCGNGEASPPSTVRAPEEQPGGAGDEEPIRVPATITFREGGIAPSVVAVPEFLTIELSGMSKDGAPHRLNFRGTVVDVPADGRASVRLEGLRAGRYGVEVDGEPGAVTIVSGAEPGP